MPRCDLCHRLLAASTQGSLVIVGQQWLIVHPACAQWLTELRRAGHPPNAAAAGVEAPPPAPRSEVIDLEDVD